MRMNPYSNVGTLEGSVIKKTTSESVQDIRTTGNNATDCALLFLNSVTVANLSYSLGVGFQISL